MADLVIAEQYIAEALTRCKGDLEATARQLKMPISRLTVRVNQSEQLTNIKRAFRAFLFDELSDFTLSAVKDGVVRQLAVDSWGNLMKDSEGNEMCIYMPVDPSTRLAAAGKLMSIIKSEAGISERVDHKVTADGSEEIKAIAAALRGGLLTAPQQAVTNSE